MNQRDLTMHLAFIVASAFSIGTQACGSGVDDSPPTVAPRSSTLALDGTVARDVAAKEAVELAGPSVPSEARAALDPIARDESDHATLSSRAADLVDGRLDAEERARVLTAKKAAITYLRASLVDPSEAFGAPLGLPSGAGSRAILKMLDEHVWS